MSSFSNYYYSYFYRIFLQKLVIFDCDTLNFANAIELQFFFNNLKDDEQKQILDALSFLENTTGKKATIFRSKFKYVGTSKKYYFGCKVVLRKELLFNFLKYFYFVIGPKYLRRQGKLPLSLEKGNCVVSIDDYAIFPNLSVMGIKGILSIKVLSGSLLKNIFFYQFFFLGR